MTKEDLSNWKVLAKKFGWTVIEGALEFEDGIWITVEFNDSKGKLFFTKEGFENFQQAREIFEDLEKKMWYEETKEHGKYMVSLSEETSWNVQQELEKKLKEQRGICKKESKYEQQIRDTLEEFTKQERAKEEKKFKEKFQQLGDILKYTDITEDWNWKVHFADMFSGYSALFEEYAQYPTSGILVHCMGQDWRDKPTEVWEGKTLMDAYKFVEEQIEELREAGVLVVYRPYDAEGRISNPGELPLKKWFSARFSPKNEPQRRWIYEAVEYLEKFGITFDTYANPTERVWQIDWSFKFNKK